MTGPPVKKSPAKSAGANDGAYFPVRSVNHIQPLASMPFGVDLAKAREIAESVVGPVDWSLGKTEAEGCFQCPGISQHEKQDRATDCSVVVAQLPGGALPGVYCFHTSCRHEVEALAFQVRSALGKGLPSSTQPMPRRPSRPARLPDPEFDPAFLAEHARRCPIDYEKLARISPKSVWNRTPAGFLHALGNPGENFLVASSLRNERSDTLWHHDGYPFDAVPRELEGFRTGALEGVYFVSSPIRDEYLERRNRKTGRIEHTRRGGELITSFRYLLLESDDADHDQWLSAIWQMPLPIASIVESCNNAPHALVRIDASSELEFNDRVAKIKPFLLRLGADRQSLSAFRWSRLAGCERLGADMKDPVTKEKRYVRFPAPRVQRLLFLDPNPSSVPICEMPEITTGYDSHDITTICDEPGN